MGCMFLNKGILSLESSMLKTISEKISYFLAFHRSSQQTAHEEALQREEDYQRQDHRDEGPSSQQVPVGAT